MSGCFCIGPQGGDKACPCAMRAEGKSPSAPSETKFYEFIRSEFTKAAEIDPLNLCACMGPRYGDPYCYCEMKRKGLTPTEPPKVEWEQFNEVLKNYGWK
jgi:hypothetical protein